VTEGLGDAFVRPADKVLARPQEHQRFVEAARVILRLDPDIKRLSQRRRTQLCRAKLETDKEHDLIMGALVLAVYRVVRDAKAAAPAIGPELARRIEAVRIFVEYLPPSQDKRRLSEATHRLRDIRDEAEKSDASNYGKGGRSQQLADRPQDQALADKVRDEAAKVRSKHPDFTQADRARQLLKQFRGRWPTHNALRMWAKRHAIEI
jgi:hypothetical protein